MASTPVLQIQKLCVYRSACLYQVFLTPALTHFECSFVPGFANMLTLMKPCINLKIFKIYYWQLKEDQKKSKNRQTRLAFGSKAAKTAAASEATAAAAQQFQLKHLKPILTQFANLEQLHVYCKNVECGILANYLTFAKLPEKLHDLSISFLALGCFTKMQGKFSLVMSTPNTSLSKITLLTYGCSNAQSGAFCDKFDEKALKKNFHALKTCEVSFNQEHKTEKAPLWSI